MYTVAKASVVFIIVHLRIVMMNRRISKQTQYAAVVAAAFVIDLHVIVAEHVAILLHYKEKKRHFSAV